MSRGSGYRQPGNWASLKAKVLRRDHDVCSRCGGDATTVDHVVPVARGGTHGLDNLAAICVPCHEAKSKAEAADGRRVRRETARLTRETHPGAL